MSWRGLTRSVKQNDKKNSNRSAAALSNSEGSRRACESCSFFPLLVNEMEKKKRKTSQFITFKLCIQDVFACLLPSFLPSSANGGPRAFFCRPFFPTKKSSYLRYQISADSGTMNSSEQRTEGKKVTLERGGRSSRCGKKAHKNHHNNTRDI